MTARRLNPSEVVRRRDDSQNMGTAFTLRADSRADNWVVREIPVDRIVPSPYQHRVDLSPDSLRPMGESFGPDGRGQVNPCLVRLNADGYYEMVAGERRWRAAKLVDRPTVLAIVRDMDDDEARAATAAENLLREGLNDWEAARAYLDLRAQVREITGRRSAGAGSVAAVPGVPLEKTQLSHYIRVGEVITPELLLQAGAGRADDPSTIDPVVVRGLGISTLMEVTRLSSPEKRVVALRRRVAAARASAARKAKRAAVAAMGEGSADADPENVQSPNVLDEQEGADVAPRRPAGSRTYEELLTEGRWRKNLTAAFTGMAPEEAGRHLGDVAPVIAALSTVEAEMRPLVRVSSVEGAAKTVLILPTADASGELDTLAALHSLVALEHAIVGARNALIRAGRLRESHGGLADSLEMANRVERLVDEITPLERKAVLAARSPGQRVLAGALRRHDTVVRGGATALNVDEAVDWTRSRLEQVRQREQNASGKSSIRVVLNGPSNPSATAVRPTETPLTSAILVRPATRGESITLGWDRSRGAAGSGSQSLTDVNGIRASLRLADDLGVDLHLSFAPRDWPGDKLLEPVPMADGHLRFQLHFDEAKAATLGELALELLTRVGQKLDDYPHSKQKHRLAASLGMSVKHLRELLRYRWLLGDLRARMEELNAHVYLEAACMARITELDARSPSHAQAAETLGRTRAPAR